MNNIIEFKNDDLFNYIKSVKDASINLVIADLPYGTTANEWDIKINLTNFKHELQRILADNGIVIFFSQQKFTSEIVSEFKDWFSHEIIWVKTSAQGFLNSKRMPLKAHENILVCSKKKGKMVYNPQFTSGAPYRKITNNKKISKNYGTIKNGENYSSNHINDGRRYPISVLRFSNASYKSKHPTQKPLDLLENLIRQYSNEYDNVADFTFGSGSTIKACINTNRSFYGCELSKDYYDIAVLWINE